MIEGDRISLDWEEGENTAVLSVAAGGEQVFVEMEQNKAMELANAIRARTRITIPVEWIFREVANG